MENPVSDSESTGPPSERGDHRGTAAETSQPLLSPRRCGGHVEPDLDLVSGD